MQPFAFLSDLMDCSLGGFYHHNRASGSVAGATHRLKSFTSRVNPFLSGFGCHLSNWGFTFEQAGLAYLQGLALCISGHHCHLSAPVRDMSLLIPVWVWMENNEDPSVVSKKPGLLHAIYFLRSLPLMTDIPKHVRRLMLKDSCTGGENHAQHGGGYKHRLPLSGSHAHTADVNHCAAPCAPPAPFINLLFTQKRGCFQMMSLSSSQLHPCRP